MEGAVAVEEAAAQAGSEVEAGEAGEEVGEEAAEGGSGLQGLGSAAAATRGRHRQGQEERGTPFLR